MSSLGSVCSDQQLQTLELGNEQELVDHHRPASINKHRTQAVILTGRSFPNTQIVRRERKSIGWPQELGPALPADINRKGISAWRLLASGNFNTPARTLLRLIMLCSRPTQAHNTMLKASSGSQYDAQGSLVPKYNAQGLLRLTIQWSRLAHSDICNQSRPLPIVLGNPNEEIVPQCSNC